MKFIFISLIKFYRRFISPLFPPCCKYYPTCSTYALTALQRFGAVRGTLLALWRLIRCNPWSMGGIDYVPEKFTFRVAEYDYGCSCSDDSCNFENNDDDNEQQRGI
ncbi:MAG: membrane protein insertion efficiency factor YidD [Ruminococcus sp.]|nr:membrane protein insertion efficiency factor YidD [Ruminococcus sp.]